MRAEPCCRHCRTSMRQAQTDGESLGSHKLMKSSRMHTLQCITAMQPACSPMVTQLPPWQGAFQWMSGVSCTDALPHEHGAYPACSSAYLSRICPGCPAARAAPRQAGPHQLLGVYLAGHLPGCLQPAAVLPVTSSSCQTATGTCTRVGTVVLLQLHLKLALEGVKKTWKLISHV